MPWWGWLIAGCVLFAGLCWVTINIIVIRAMKKYDEQTDRIVEGIRRGPSRS